MIKASTDIEIEIYLEYMKTELEIRKENENNKGIR